MSDAEKMSRKELLQPIRLEKKLYAFVDHTYRKKHLYISAAVSVVVLILAIWGGWKYLQNERINQANQYHIARAMLTNPALSEDERLTQGISALRDFANSQSGTTLSVLALMESGEAYARQSQIEESIAVFEKVIKYPEVTTFLLKSI